VPPRRRGLRRPRVILPAAAIAALAAAGAGGYLGFHLKNSGSSQRQAAAAVTKPKAPSAAGAATPSASALTTATAVASGAPGASAAAAANAAEYTTPEPFPLCDPDGGTWTLDNLTPQSGGCVPNMQAVLNAGGYGFGTLSSFPHGVPALSANNTVTVSGQIGDYDSTVCLGAAEGSATSGYIGLVCDNGQWYINDVNDLGTSGAVVGKQLATGSFPYSQSTTYVISLAFGPGTGKMTVNFSQGSASPLSEPFNTGSFIPNAVGYALQGAGANEADTIAGFLYTVN
jgi:hypothetical protein